MRNGLSVALMSFQKTPAEWVALAGAIAMPSISNVSTDAGIPLLHCRASKGALANTMSIARRSAGNSTWFASTGTSSKYKKMKAKRFDSQALTGRLIG
ncbi:hypothetical protein [Corallococcus sp. AB038B]|uniref:hypothetical protein n=1 Tax=Corallococcus sp. AB038B TaxID=2316718 RepID=UPI0013159440|nr:hypothetical protein [Corallococcus sp. AB038B]